MLQWVPHDVSSQLHDAIADLDLRMLRVASLVQDQKVANEIGALGTCIHLWSITAELTFQA